MLRRLTLLICLLAIPFAGCGEEEAPPACYEQLCEPFSTVCIGEDKAECDGDGKRWTVTPCTNGRCKEATQQCVSYDCVPGASVCSAGSDNQVERCPDSGSGWGAPESCPGDEVCVAGTCVAATCESGATRCGYRQVLTCDGGVWVGSEDPCGADAVCREDADGAACETLECIPGTSVCEGAAVVGCSQDGSLLAAAPCAGNEVCQDGHCRVKVCGIDDQPTPDVLADTGAGADDAGPTGPEVAPPPLEKVSKISFDLNGIPQSFDLNARADFIGSTNTLKISAGAGSRKVEINIGPLEPAVVGAFNDTDTSEIVVTVCYFDGVTETQAPDCTVGFSHSSIGYSVELTEHQNPGRVIGTFSSELQNAASEPAEITNGVFDVQHK